MNRQEVVGNWRDGFKWSTTKNNRDFGLSGHAELGRYTLIESIYHPRNIGASDHHSSLSLQPGFCTLGRPYDFIEAGAWTG